MPEVRRVVREQGYTSRPSTKQGSGPRRNLPHPPWKFWLVTILVMGGFIALSQLFYIKEVTVSGTTNLSPAEIKTAAENSLHGALLPTNLLWLDTGTLKYALQTNYPTLGKVELSRHWPHTLGVKVTERSPALLWQSNGTDYAVDQAGYAISNFPANVNLPIVVDSANLPVKNKVQLVPSSFVSFVHYFYDQLYSATKLKVTGLTIAASTSEVNLQTDHNFVLRLDTTRKPVGEMGDLKLVLKQLAAAKQTPSLYIDLRVSGRAYYK